MARIVLGLVAVIACFMLAESLSCNKCRFNAFGYCIGTTTMTCTNTNTTSCFTGQATFKSLPSFTAINSQGCLPSNVTCNSTVTDTLLGLEYTAKTTCCESDDCNPVTLTSDAPATKLTFTAAVGAALLASVWGSVQ